MDNKIISNHTLEDYKKKYCNRNYKLLKFTKKEVEAFDKKNPTKKKGYLLRGRRWWLIGDTYYEIPKPFTFTWFRNLNKAIQIGTCVLAAGVIASAVAVPVVITTMNKQSEPSITVTGATIDREKSSIVLNKDSTVAFTYPDNKEFVKISFVKVGDKVISSDLYTLVDGNTQSKKVVIKAQAMTSIKVEISVELKDKQPGPTPEEKYTITLIADPEDGGTVTGGGAELIAGTKITLTADANDGYRFSGFYDGDTLLSSESPYEYTVISSKELKAKFVKQCHIFANADPNKAGTVSGAGTYDYGSQVTLTGIPLGDYLFDGWYANGQKVSDKSSYTFTVTSNMMFTAKFGVKRTVSVSAETGGTATGGGDYIDGKSVTVVATPDSGYLFDGWYENDVKIDDAQASYTFNINKNRTLVAKFTPQVKTSYNLAWTKQVNFGGDIGNKSCYELAKNSYAGCTTTKIIFGKTTDYTEEIKTLTLKADVGETAEDKITAYYDNSTKGASILYVLSDKTIAFDDKDRPNYESSTKTGNGIFESCVNVEDIKLENINTTAVTDMSNMFYKCTGMYCYLDLSAFDTSNVTNMSYMFAGAAEETGYWTHFNGINLSSFNTSNVTNMECMFSDYYVNSDNFYLDLSAFDTSNVTKMKGMFSDVQFGGHSLSTVYIDSQKFNTTKVLSIDGDKGVDMFKGATAFIGEQGTKCDGENNIDANRAKIDGGRNDKGYFYNAKFKPSEEKYFDFIPIEDIENKTGEEATIAYKAKANTKGESMPSIISIPSRYNELDVKSIDEKGFAIETNDEKYNGIVIPKSVKEIGANAFLNSIDSNTEIIFRDLISSWTIEDSNGVVENDFDPNMSAKEETIKYLTGNYIWNKNPDPVAIDLYYEESFEGYISGDITLNPGTTYVINVETDQQYGGVKEAIFYDENCYDLLNVGDISNSFVAFNNGVKCANTVVKEYEVCFNEIESEPQELSGLITLRFTTLDSLEPKTFVADFVLTLPEI